MIFHGIFDIIDANVTNHDMSCLKILTMKFGRLLVDDALN